MNCASKSVPKNFYGFEHKEHHGHQYGAHGNSSGQTHQYGKPHGQTPQYGQTHAYNHNYTVPKTQTECYSETQESYYLETNTARPGQSYGQAYGQSPCSVTQTHGYPSGHAQNDSHDQASYGLACHERTGKHKKAGKMCKTKCKTGYQSGSDSGSDCDSD